MFANDIIAHLRLGNVSKIGRGINWAVLTDTQSLFRSHHIFLYKIDHFVEILKSPLPCLCEFQEYRTEELSTK
jgi:hypothetical protein